MTYPLLRPNPPATFAVGDFANELVLVVIGGYHPEVSTREYGVKPAERVSIVMLTGRTAGMIYDDVMIWGAKLSSQFRDHEAGSVVACRIVKSGKSIVFDPVGAYDEQQAQHWVAANRERLEQLRADTLRCFLDHVEEAAADEAPATAAADRVEPEAAHV